MIDVTSSAKVQETEKPRSGLGAFLLNVWGTAKVFLVSLAIVVPIRAYVVQPFFVRGESMAPNFHDGEYLIIDEFSFRTGLRPLERGDVVVFRYPLNRSQYYIKRVVGIPGETIRVANNVVTIFSAEFPQGIVLDESPYLSASADTRGEASIRLGEGEVFVLGDNRDHSSDSRSWGALSEDLIVGRAWVRAFPFARAGAVRVPWYGFLSPGEGAVTAAP